MSADPLAAVDEKLKAARPNGHDAGAAALRLIDPRNFQGCSVPERDWIVPEWVPKGYVTGLFGPGGTGKSLVAMQLMTALARGKPWLGQMVEPRRSVGIFCEDDEEELQRRQAAINREIYGCDFRDLGAFRWSARTRHGQFAHGIRPQRPRRDHAVF